jgi:hypothetical protein
MTDRRTAHPGDLRHISDVITDLAEDGSPVHEDAKAAIREGTEPHRLCLCHECMRAYLAAADRGDVA